MTQKEAQDECKEIDNNPPFLTPEDCLCDERPPAPWSSFPHSNEKCPLIPHPLGTIARIYRMIRTYEEGLEREDYDLIDGLKRAAKIALTKDQVAKLEEIVQDMKIYWKKKNCKEKNNG